MIFDIVAGSRYVIIDRWHWWLAYAVVVFIFWYFLARRTYKLIDGKPYVRHWRFGKWIDLEKHLKEEHTQDYIKIEQDNDKENKS